MSVHLDDQMFDESPGVVCVVLSHAIEAAGWRLVHVSETGDRVVWEVLDEGNRTEVLEALISPHGHGAAVSVHSVPRATDARRPEGHGQVAPVIDLHPRVEGFGPPRQPPFGPDLG